MQCPRCGDCFAQLASQASRIQDVPSLWFAVRTSDHINASAKDELKLQLKSWTPRAVQPHSTWPPSHRIRGKTPASAIAVARVSVFRKRPRPDHDPHLEVPVPPPPDGFPAARLRRLRGSTCCIILEALVTAAMILAFAIHLHSEWTFVQRCAGVRGLVSSPLYVCFALDLCLSLVAPPCSCKRLRRV